MSFIIFFFATTTDKYSSIWDLNQLIESSQSATSLYSLCVEVGHVHASKHRGLWVGFWFLRKLSACTFSTCINMYLYAYPKMRIYYVCITLLYIWSRVCFLHFLWMQVRDKMKCSTKLKSVKLFQVFHTW